MATETRSFVEVFFNFYDAEHWLEKMIVEYGEGHPDYVIKEAENKLMPSGGWRVGLVLEKK